MFVSSFATALTVKMNYYLGHNQPALAKKFTFAGIYVMFAMMTFFGITFKLSTKYFVYIFSSDPLVIEIFETYSWIISILLVFYGVSNELTRVINNMGKTK